MLTSKRVKGVLPAVTLAEAKLHCSVDFGDDDVLIDTVRRAATSTIESNIGGAILPQSWDFFFSRWHSEIQFDQQPLSSVTSIKYLDTDNVQQTWLSSNYEVDTVCGRIRALSSATFPSLGDRYNPVEIRAVIGFDDVPSELIQAVLLLCRHYYENREAVVTQNTAFFSELPMGVEYLIDPFRRARFGT